MHCCYIGIGFSCLFDSIDLYKSKLGDSLHMLTHTNLNWFPDITFQKSPQETQEKQSQIK